MVFRPYDTTRHQQQVLRIWQEVNWLAGDQGEKLDHFITACGGGFVAEVNGAAECLVLRCAGDLRHLDGTLPFGCITGVTTSRIARKLGLAARLTAWAVAQEAAAGAAVVGLGMFEQGFYNRLGFGTGSYEHHCHFNPATLTVDIPFRVPERLSADDWAAIHACRLRRQRGHGSVSLTPPEFTMGRLQLEGGGFGLGYRDEPGGGFSHLIFCTNDRAYHGPLKVKYLLYQTREQLLELLALLRSLGDQILSVEVSEPVGVQLQDLIRQPFAQHEVTQGGKYPTHLSALAWWQMRICDLPAALAATRLSGPAVRFNLVLSDPLPDLLAEGAAWRGMGGEYVVTLGEESSARLGSDPSLPALTATVNAFTRLWLGVRPATGLATTDHLGGPEQLLTALDRLLLLPRPWPQWDM